MNTQHESGEIVADRYRIVETLGQGGNGITYKAECLEKGDFVALKALSLRQMQDWKPLELFEREARILQQLNHPRIPRYLDYFYVDTPENRAFYIVQELVEGQSLAAMVEKGWRTNEAGVRRIAMQVLEILVYLHDLKPPVIHRDIKPQNLIWGKEGNIFLVDFGAVRDTYNSTFARGSTVVGTFGYMAPEQFQGQAVPATDLYGLGTTVLFLLTHRSPADLPEERLKISFRSRVKISDSFADWLERMVEPDAGDRFSSAQEALDLLRGKVAVKKGRSSVPWKTVAGIGVAGVATAVILNYFQYGVLGVLGFEFTEICDAASAGQLDPVKVYLSRGGSFNAKFGNDRSLLDCSLDSGKIEPIELLLDRGLKIDSKNANGATPLHVAIQNKNKDLAKFLIDRGADVNARIRHNRGHTPLLLAIMNRQLEVAKLLIDRGADVNARYSQNGYGDEIPLIHAAASSAAAASVFQNDLEVDYIDYQLLKLLVESGADVNAIDSMGRSLLFRIIGNCEFREASRLEMCTKTVKLIIFGSRYSLNN